MHLNCIDSVIHRTAYNMLTACVYAIVILQAYILLPLLYLIKRVLYISPKIVSFTYENVEIPISLASLTHCEQV